MTDKLLREFRASLETDKNKLIEEGARIDKELNEYGLGAPYTFTKTKVGKRKLRIDSNGLLYIAGYKSRYGYFSRNYWEECSSDSINATDIRRLVENGRTRLKNVESQFDKVISPYSTEIAEFTFSGVTGKKNLVRALVDRRMEELREVFLTNIKEGAVDRLYVKMSVHTFIFEFDCSSNYTSLRNLNLNFNRSLKFLSEFQEIKQEISQKFVKLFRKEEQ